MKRTNQKGVTLIALIVTIIVLIIIAGISIATLTGDNGGLQQTNAARVTQIEETARKKVELGCSALKLAIEEAVAKDGTYSALDNASKIQDVLVDVLEKDKAGLDGKFTKADTEGADKIAIKYVGNDYKNATNNTEAEIIYTIELGKGSIELVDEENATLKDENGNDVNIDIGGGEGSGDDESQGTKLSDVAKIGQYVNYDPTTGGNVTAENTTYTSMPGSTTEHGNGYTDDADGQTFSAANYKNAGGKWRILDIDESGNITLISDLIYQDSGNTMGTTGLYLSNGVGYIWAEEELHRIASIYGHGKGAYTNQTVTYYYGGPNDQDGSIEEIDADGDGVIDNLAELQQGRQKTLNLSSGARALTVEDINKICGVNTTYTANYSDGTVTKNSDNATYYPTINGASSTGKSEVQSTFSGSYYSTYYGYSIESANSDTDAQTKQNSMLKLGEYYWLASRSVSTYSDDTYFYVRYVSSGGLVRYYAPCYCIYGSWYANTPSYGVRAVVNLKSGIQTGDAEYDSTSGWNLVD